MRTNKNNIDQLTPTTRIIAGWNGYGTMYAYQELHKYVFIKIWRTIYEEYSRVGDRNYSEIKQSILKNVRCNKETSADIANQIKNPFE